MVHPTHPDANAMRSLALLLLLATPALAAPTVRVRFTTPIADVTRLELVQDGVTVRSDLLTAASACGADWCLSLPLPTRGSVVNYELRACNLLGECALSNRRSLPVPGLPVAPALSVTVEP